MLQIAGLLDGPIVADFLHTLNLSEYAKVLRMESDLVGIYWYIVVDVVMCPYRFFSPSTNYAPSSKDFQICLFSNVSNHEVFAERDCLMR